MNFGATKGELRINSLLESAFESYTLRPLNVRPWPRSYPLLNLPAFPHALCRLYKHLIQFHSCSKVLLYSMRFLNLVMLLLFGSRLNKIQSWLFIKASRCNERWRQQPFCGKVHFDSIPLLQPVFAMSWRQCTCDALGTNARSDEQPSLRNQASRVRIVRCLTRQGKNRRELCFWTRVMSYDG